MNKDVLAEALPDLIGEMCKFNRNINQTYEIASFSKGTTSTPSSYPIHFDSKFLLKLNYQDRFQSVEELALVLNNIYDAFPPFGGEGRVKEVIFLVGGDDKGNYTPIYVVHEKKIKKEEQDAIESGLGVRLEEITKDITRLIPV